MSAEAIEVSVVVPVFDEADNVERLAAEIQASFRGTQWEYRHEIIFVDDASRDGTAERLAGTSVRVLQHLQNRGQSAAIWTGILGARGETIVTLDGDGQNDPAAIPALLEALAHADVAVGYRETREDRWHRRFASRVAYWVRNLLLGDGIVDIGCALRAFPKSEVYYLPVFDGLHRLMPALFTFRGLTVAQVPTSHRPREAGVSKYTNVGRGFRGLFDLLGLFWLKRRLLRRDVDSPVVSLRPSS